jgi:hypothetical protein
MLRRYLRRRLSEPSPSNFIISILGYAIEARTQGVQGLFIYLDTTL